jgi:diadenosine tetraphosphate (Ap4A) HIT family hydrolase
MTEPRVPVDPAELAAYVRRAREGPCFVCATIAGLEGYEHEMILDEPEHVAFLSRYPTVVGYALVCPRRHVEHVVGDLTEAEYLRLQAVVYRVARAVEAVVTPERMYLLSLGSQQGNAHIHWHIAPLPPGTPYEHQQFHALMAEHGRIPWSPQRAAELGARIRAALVKSTFGAI